MAKKKKELMTMISTFMPRADVAFLDRKINKKDPQRKTRGAVLRLIIDNARKNKTI